MKWVYGITTVPERRDTLLPRTLQSLRNAGFPCPQIFVDGATNPEPYRELGLEVTVRPKVKALGNFVLSLWQLYLGNPLADRYAVFQDDVIFTRNLRQYLEQFPCPADGYANLFTFLKANEKIVEGKPRGWYKSDQMGRGALALVFSREAVVSLLSAHTLAMKPQNVKYGDRKIDGAVVTALSPRHKHGKFFEYIHCPSLVQHIGDKSAIGNHNQPKAKTFPGEDFDCLTWLDVVSGMGG